MLRKMLAAAAAIPLVIGLAAPISVAETGVTETPAAEPEPPRNRVSPTDDTELPQRAAPPLAPPQPLAPRRISEPPPESPGVAPPPTEATPKPAIKSAMKHQATSRRAIARKTATMQRKTGTPQRQAVTAQPPRHDDSLGALFTPGRTRPQRISPDAPPSTFTYNYLGPPAARLPARATRTPAAGPCANRSATSLSALFTCR
jgi:hypothetical protein